MAARLNQVKGFTLVELLVVIAIISVLSVIGIVVFTGIQKEARDSKRKTDINAIAKSFEVKYNQTGSYGDLSPENNNDLFASKQFPKDPSGKDYTITKNPISSGFRVCATLEGESQPFCKTSIQAEAPGTGGINDTSQPVTNPDSFAASEGDKPRIAIMQNMASALDRYKTSKGRYPKTGSGGDIGSQYGNCSNFPDWNQGGFSGLVSTLINEGYLNGPIIDNGKAIMCGGGSTSWGDLGKGAQLGDLSCGWDHCHIYGGHAWPAGYHYWSDGSSYKLILIQSDNSKFTITK